MVTVFICIFVALIAMTYSHFKTQFKLWAQTDNKVQLLKKWFRFEIPISFISVLILSYMIYENQRPLTQIEKDERTYSDFNEIVTPLLKWCYENTDSSFKDRVKDSKGNMIVFSSNGELQIKNSVYLCLTSNQFRESLIEQNVEKYKLKVIEKYRIASNHKYFESLNLVRPENSRHFLW